MEIETRDKHQSFYTLKGEDMKKAFIQICMIQICMISLHDISV